MAPTTQIRPTAWSIVAAIFIALFAVVLFICVMIIGYLRYQRKQAGNVNPYPFGSADWQTWEQAATSRSGDDALAIAALEAQLSLQQDYNVEADKMIELLEMTNKNLDLKLRDQAREMDPVDPEVFQRIYDDLHKPMTPPSLRSTSTSSSTKSGPMLLQTTKLCDIMRSNSRSSPERSSRLVESLTENPIPSSAISCNSDDSWQ